ncbi:MAG: DUF4831 family protein [Bacteroidaceae bacterium]|nr:DUF4831 family protein [Bacteroidaceae bacterium]
MKLRNLFISTLITLPLAVSAQTETSIYKPGVTNDGVTYFLPKTAIKVEVCVQNTEYTPGEFSKYADRYLHMKGIQQERQNYWEIKAINLSTVGLPDTTKVYSIKLKDKTSAPLVALTKSGIILGINKDVKEEVTDTIPLPEPFVEDHNPREFMTEDILSAGSTAKMAELSAKEIYNIRDSKNSITRGLAENMPKDGLSMQLMLDELNKQENGLTKMFKGTTKATYKKHTFYVVPTSDITKDIVFRFSKKLGIVDADDMGGSPVYISVEDLHTLPQTDTEAAKKKKFSEKGVYYNIPSKAVVRLTDSSASTIASKECEIAQFGKTELLSDALFNKKNTTKVSFFQTTGGIKSIEGE